MKIFSDIFQDKLFKVASLNSLSVLIKIISGIIVSKFIAVFVGPSGMALVGNLRNFLTTIESIATLGFTNGIIKYVSEHEKDKDKLRIFLATIIQLILLIVGVTSLIIFFFADYLNQSIFTIKQDYQAVFKIFALSLPWYIASIVLLSILNGFSVFKKVIYSAILGNIFGLIISVLLIYNFKTFGALVAVILSPSIQFFFVLYYVNQIIDIKTIFSFKLFDKLVIKKMLEFSFMTLFAATFGPLIYLKIRYYIIETINLKSAGYWESITRISSYYLLFLTSIISVYFLPKLAKTKTNEEVKIVFFSYYKGIIPVFSLGLILIFIFKDSILQLLFTKEFLPVSDLFFWQLLGDFFKALSLILGYNLFAKKMTKVFLISEIISLAILWISSIFFIDIFGIKGVVIAHTLTFFLYFMGLFIYFRKQLFL